MTDHEAARAKLAEIVAGLEGVTPGPWDDSGDKLRGVGAQACYPAYICHGSDRNDANSANMAHIARCDPDAIRSIAAYVDGLEAENARLREALEMLAMIERSIYGGGLTVTFDAHDVAEMRRIREAARVAGPDMPNCAEADRAALEGTQG